MCVNGSTWQKIARRQHGIIDELSALNRELQSEILALGQQNKILRDIKKLLLTELQEIRHDSRTLQRRITRFYPHVCKTADVEIRQE